MSALDLIKYGAPIVAALAEAGVVPVVCQDFDEIADREKEIGKSFTHPMFRPERNDFVRGEAFWLFLTNDDKIIAGLVTCSPWSPRL